MGGRFDSPFGVMILLYHRIHPELPEHPLIIRPEQFQDQMQFLASKPQVYDFVRLRDFERDPERFFDQKSTPTKVIITLDDGYRDNYLYAFPVLKKYQLPATIFLTTDLVNTDQTFKRYEDVKERDMLNMAEIREMIKAGISFGGHTCSHPHLPQLSEEDQKREIINSLHALKELVPEPGRVATFCYPYGEYNEITLRIVQEAGCPCALSVRQGVNQKGVSMLELKRVEISGLDSMKSFEYKVLEKFRKPAEENP